MITPQTLQNAARAIECDLWTDPSGANYLVKDGAILRRWEPLEDDGDAFRLMIALRMDVDQFPGFGEVHASDCGRYMKAEVNYTGDLAVDTRNAIILCAAQMGESL